MAQPAEEGRAARDGPVGGDEDREADTDDNRLDCTGCGRAQQLCAAGICIPRQAGSAFAAPAGGRDGLHIVRPWSFPIGPTCSALPAPIARQQQRKSQLFVVTTTTSARQIPAMRGSSRYDPAGTFIPLEKATLCHETPLFSIPA